MDQNVWGKKLLLNSINNKLTREWIMSGMSKSALRTGFKVGPFFLDAGHSNFNSWNLLLITHGHADHIFSLPSFFLTDNVENSHVITPEVYKIRRYIESFMSCNGSIMPNATFTESTHMNSIELANGRERYKVTSFKLNHGVVPTYGYGIDSIVKKLNPVLLKMKEKFSAKDFGKIMSDLKRGLKSEHLDLEETPVDVDVIKPQICYITDTSIVGVSGNFDFIKKYLIIIIECTFFHTDEILHAQNKKHIHWTQLHSYIKDNPESHWILIHSSTRYKDLNDIRVGINSNKQNTVPSNCSFWI